MSQEKTEIDKSACQLTKLPKFIKYEISSYMDGISLNNIASFYGRMFDGRNHFQDYRLLTKLSLFIAAGNLGKAATLLNIRPDLKSQIDTLLQKELFKLAGVGDQDKMEEILKISPELLLSYASLKDISGVELVITGKQGITIFQHAIWARDVRYMCNMMLNCLPKTTEGEEIRCDLKRQQEELEANGVAYKLNGEMHSGEKQFSLKQLIDALQTYVDKFDDWSWKQREEHWCTIVGLAQTLLPANVRQHYCDPEESFEKPNFRKPTFKRSLEFYNYLKGKVESWGSSLAGLGVNFGIVRAEDAVGSPGESIGCARVDLAAITAFNEVRTNDLNELIQRLQSPIQILEENQEQIFGNY